MSLLIPSEATLDRAVESLKRQPGAFQRLVEGYVRLADPDRYRKLVPHGRRSDDVTLRGWPDAYVVRPDGTTDAVEMTHSDRWQKHLENDLAKIRSANNLASFLFVAWANTPRCEKIRDFHERLERAGVPRAEIRLVFRQELVAALHEPQYARLWSDPLGLQVSTSPFKLYQEADLFGNAHRPGAFRPTLQEYTDGRVHLPAIASEVKEQLSKPALFMNLLMEGSLGG